MSVCVSNVFLVLICVGTETTLTFVRRPCIRLYNEINEGRIPVCGTSIIKTIINTIDMHKQ